MPRTISVLAALAIILFALGPAAHGQTATMTLRTIDHVTEPGGRFVLSVSVSPGHSFGIAGYSVQLLGSFTFDHLAPGVTAANGSAGSGAVAGFTVLRTPDLPAPGGSLIVSASQNTVTPTPYIYFGVGQGAVDFVSGPTNGPVTIVTPGDTTQDDAFLSELVIGEGTYPGAAPTIDQFSVDNVVQVFTSNTGVATATATLVLNEVSGPVTFLEAPSIQVVAAVSFPTMTDTLYEVVSIDTEGGEVTLGRVAGDGSMMTVADVVNLPLDTSLKYEVRTGSGTVTPSIQIAAALSFETMSGKLYEVISFDTSGNEQIVGRTAGDGSAVTVADLTNLPLAGSRLYRVARLN